MTMTIRQRKLTKRQQEILVLLAKGIIKKDIAKILGVSYNSVRKMVKDLYRNLDVHNAAEAVSEGYQIGYLKVIK